MTGPTSTKSEKEILPSQPDRRRQEQSRQYPSSGPQADLLALQRQVGNRAVRRWLLSEVTAADAGKWLPPTALDLLGSPGEPLDSHVRETMELAFHHEFDDVRIHRDWRAHVAANLLGAEAFTFRSDIWFARHADFQDRHLLAHELAHVLQQRNGSPQTTPTNTAQKGVFERLAETAGQRAAGGYGDAHLGLLAAPASPGGPAPQGIQCYPIPQTERDHRLDEFAAMLERAFTAGLQHEPADMLVDRARSGVQRFSDARGPRHYAAQNATLVAIYNILNERIRSAPRDANGLPQVQGLSWPAGSRNAGQLTAIPPFQHINDWIVDAAIPPPAPVQVRRPRQGRAPARDISPTPTGPAAQPPAGRPSRTPSLLRVGTPLEQQRETPEEAAGGWQGDVAGAIAGFATDVPQQRTGGAGEIGQGLADLRSATIGQLMTAATELLQRTEEGEMPPEVRARRGAGSQTSLLSATGAIWYISPSRVFVLDRSGHIVGGDFMHGLRYISLTRGTYFMFPLVLGGRRGRGSRLRVLARVSGGQVRMGERIGDFMPETFLGGVVPLLRQGNQVLRSNAGIAVIVSGRIGERMERNWANLRVALLGSRRHLQWAIRQEIARYASLRGLGQLAMEIAFDLAMQRIAQAVPTVGLGVMGFGLLQEAAWLGETASLAVYARTEDELDIASQAIARKLVETVVGEIRSATTRGGARAVGRMRARAGAAPPSPAPEAPEVRPTPAQPPRAAPGVPEPQPGRVGPPPFRPPAEAPPLRRVQPPPSAPAAPAQPTRAAPRAEARPAAAPTPIGRGHEIRARRQRQAAERPPAEPSPAGPTPSSRRTEPRGAGEPTPIGRAREIRAERQRRAAEQAAAQPAEAQLAATGTEGAAVVLPGAQRTGPVRGQPAVAMAGGQRRGRPPVRGPAAPGPAAGPSPGPAARPAVPARPAREAGRAGGPGARRPAGRTEPRGADEPIPITQGREIRAERSRRRALARRQQEERRRQAREEAAREREDIAAERTEGVTRESRQTRSRARRQQREAEGGRRPDPRTRDQVESRRRADSIYDRAQRGEFSSASETRRRQLLDRFERLMRRAAASAQEISSRKGRLNELLRTPTRAVQTGRAQPEFLAGGPRLPGQGRRGTTRPDFTDIRRLPDGRVQRVHVNDKSDDIHQMSRSEAVTTARRYTDDAVVQSRGAQVGAAAPRRRLRRGPRVGPLPQGDAVVIRYAQTPNRATQEAMVREHFRPDSPITEVHFGSTVYRRRSMDSSDFDRM